MRWIIAGFILFGYLCDCHCCSCSIYFCYCPTVGKIAPRKRLAGQECPQKTWSRRCVLTILFSFPHLVVILNRHIITCLLFVLVMLVKLNQLFLVLLSQFSICFAVLHDNDTYCFSYSFTLYPWLLFTAFLSISFIVFLHLTWIQVPYLHCWILCSVALRTLNTRLCFGMCWRQNEHRLWFQCHICES